MKLVSVGITLLGFDPWSESRQGLANLLEEETRPAPHVAQSQFSHVSSAPRPGFPFRGNIDRVSSSDAPGLYVFTRPALSLGSFVCLYHSRPSVLSVSVSYLACLCFVFKRAKSRIGRRDCVLCSRTSTSVFQVSAYGLYVEEPAKYRVRPHQARAHGLLKRRQYDQSRRVRELLLTYS